MNLYQREKKIMVCHYLHMSKLSMPINWYKLHKLLAYIKLQNKKSHTERPPCVWCNSKFLKNKIIICRNWIIAQHVKTAPIAKNKVLWICIAYITVCAMSRLSASWNLSFEILKKILFSSLCSGSCFTWHNCIPYALSWLLFFVH